MQVFDASSVIYGWDNYPINQFPGVWEWIATEINSGNLKISSVALEEVRKRQPDCADWLKSNNILELSLNQAILLDSVRIKTLLGIVGDSYNARGVGENDLLIIAVARAFGAQLISDEKKQLTIPMNLANMKIPAVCALPGVGVSCINFVEFIKNSGVTFG